MDAVTDIRRTILSLFKRGNGMTIAELAERLGVTYEAIRQQVVLMEREGWIEGKIYRTEMRTAGRPITHYSITPSGDHFFPKSYDGLALTLFETVDDELGADATKQVLAALTEEQVRSWESRLEGKCMEERVAMLRDLYFAGDPFMEIERTADGLRLVERNCPYLNVAMAHPGICSVSVGVLSRLLGVHVRREKRFQDGDQCCAFRVLFEQPVVSDDFQFETAPGIKEQE